MRILSLLSALFLIGCVCGCGGITPVESRGNFTFSKALIELSYISKDQTEIQQLLTIVETNNTPSKKFAEWDLKFDDQVKIDVIKRYLKEGHRGL